MMTKVYIGLGSNLNDPKQQLLNAIQCIKQITGVTLQQVSSFYKSKPVGPQNQPDFINAVIKLETELEAEDLMNKLQAIENEQGREREVHWGPRTLDLDILLYGKQQLKSVHLTIPHHEMKNRYFVLVPLFELDPELDIPGMGSITRLLENCEKADIEKIV